MEEEIKNVTPQENPEEKNNGGVGLIILNVFLALLTIFLLGYIAYKNGYIDLNNILNIKKAEDSSEQENTEQEDTQEEESMNVFDGEYISAILPEGWTIQEYEDGDGTDMLVEGVTYTGITGIHILKGTTLVMEIGAVSGIGFVGCPEIPLFDDSDPAYTEEQEDMNEEVDMDLETLDYTNTAHTDFVFLGKSMRRVNIDLYYDTESNNNTFEPQCEKGFMTLNGLSFIDSYEYEGTAYYTKITSGIPEEDLLVLDGILASMTVN